ncbi:DEAD/DEAH box helicase [Massilia sp. PWRC2]|uniref:DEAD/DEAH box helicase n=1 Tax=Massilia sp. PWRC2 TaxID=2804626 RepID=UPI003CEDAC0A
MPAAYLNTLRYWWDAEALMYPDLPKAGQRPQLLLRYSDRLPWSGAAAADDHKYFVYFGLVEKHALEAELAALFKVSGAPESYSGNYQRATRGKTFLCAIEVAADGTPLTSTLQLAAFGVAFAERHDGLPRAYGAIAAALQEQVGALTSMSSSSVADGAWFEQVCACLFARLAWQPGSLLAREQLCIQKVALLDWKGKRLANPPELDPVNSFYLEDLERIRVAAQEGSGAVQVARYLDGEAQAGERVDITSIAAIDAALAPQRCPAGRWPSDFPLFLMQQVAVNLALETLRDGGIFAVNGPPGTGKTTLLMDVIAARLVERATILATFDDPQQAFERAPEAVEYPANGAGKALRGAIHTVDARLLDCAIVVASANNKAVENITLDLPSLKKVSPQPLQRGMASFDYFAASAESILNDDAGEDARASLQCWGLISVPLGNRKNRNRVAARLGRFGDAGLFQELDKIPHPALDWDAARSAYQAALARVQAIAADIGRHDVVLAQLQASRAAVVDAGALVLTCGQRQRAASTALQAIAGAIADGEAALATNLAERELLARQWPWWRQLFARLLRPTVFARCALRRQQLDGDDDRLSAGRASVRRARLEALAELEAAGAALQGAEATLAAAKRTVHLHAAQQRALAAALGPAAFDAQAFAMLPPEQQHKTLPRSNPAYQAARAHVFVAAMHLHKAFMKNAGKAFRTNFQLALAMLEQQAFLAPHLPQMAPHLWASFFLAVPVVSSTFASVARCFRDLGEGQIGLLLVDEAGQAVPSHALGAIWRARRALIVGDPLQVEPVIKLDRQLDLAMLSFHGAPAAHQLTACSAQQLADRGNRHGAIVVQYDGSELWVGAPLRVHQRCVEPMFSLSNQIAYNEQMVFGPAVEDEVAASAARPLLGPSGWHDVVSGHFDGHSSAAEGQLAVALVLAYAANEWVGKDDGLPELFLVSPFKSVADSLQSALRRRQAEWADGASDEAIASWLQQHVGTVHTFQGKQSETVCFVMGGASAGARSWAGSRPNLINVAVTRACRRLYVIGDRSAWSATVFGRQLAQALPLIN